MEMDDFLEVKSEENISATDDDINLPGPPSEEPMENIGLTPVCEQVTCSREAISTDNFVCPYVTLLTIISPSTCLYPYLLSIFRPVGFFLFFFFYCLYTFLNLITKLRERRMDERNVRFQDVKEEMDEEDEEDGNSEELRQWAAFNQQLEMFKDQELKVEEQVSQ